MCDRCRGRDARELFVADVQKIHARLTQQKIGGMMRGDHLIEELRGRNGVYDMKTAVGITFKRSSGFKDAMGQVLKDNGVLLKGVTVVQPRQPKGGAKRPQVPED